MDVDGGKLVDKLLERNRDLTLQNAILEVNLETAIETNRQLTALVMSYTEATQNEGDASEEVNEDPGHPDPGVRDDHFWSPELR